MPAGKLRHNLYSGTPQLSFVKISAEPQTCLEIAGCPARHKARALRSEGTLARRGGPGT
jgi:hypothetical protein